MTDAKLFKVCFSNFNWSEFKASGLYILFCMEYRQGSHTKYKIEYHFVWARRYLCVTAGELTKKMIKEYLTHHFERAPNDGFDIDT